MSFARSRRAASSPGHGVRMEPDTTTGQTIDLRRYFTDRAVTALLIAALNAPGRGQDKQRPLANDER